jgi:hypothetical protein
MDWMESLQVRTPGEANDDENFPFHRGDVADFDECDDKIGSLDCLLGS